MIARSWRGVARSGAADDYVRHLRTDVFPELHKIPGHRGATVLRKDLEDGVEFVVLTYWDSMDAIRRFAGIDPDVAVVPPEAQALMREFDETVRHYDVVEGGA